MTDPSADGGEGGSGGGDRDDRPDRFGVRGPDDTPPDPDADGRRPPASVLLPTRAWTPACDDLARCLRPGDQLLVVCDRPADPVAAGPTVAERVRRARRTDGGREDGGRGGGDREDGGREGGDREDGGRTGGDREDGGGTTPRATDRKRHRPDGDRRASRTAGEDGGPSDPGACGEPTVELVVAGDPEGCSGKANAVAAGMERAVHDRIVWTDDDFRRDPDWLDRLVAAGCRGGPTSALPVFVGGGAFRLLEPVFAVGVSTGFDVWDLAWGGGVTFARGDLAAGTDVPDLARALRGAFSDDTLLGTRLERHRTDPGMVARVRVPGDPRAVANRALRFGRILHLYHPWRAAALGVVGVLVWLSTALSPVVTALGATLAARLAYRRYGLDRATWLLAFPAFLLIPVLYAAAVAVDTVEWGGRRYRWRAPGDVTVLGD